MGKYMKRGFIGGILTIVTLGLFLLTAVSGCQQAKPSNTESTTEEVIRIAAFLYRFDDPFIVSIVEEIDNEKNNLIDATGRKVIVDFIDGNNQKDIQYAQIVDALDNGYDAMMVNLVDRSDAQRVIEKAKEADIPLVFFNREPVAVDMARWDQVYYVGTKGEESGILQGEIIADYWLTHPQADKNEDGVMQYVMLQGQAEHQDALLRTEFSIKTIESYGIEVEMLASDVANWQRSQASKKTTNYLTLFDTSIEMIISNNDMMALGAIDAIEASGYSVKDNFPVVGVDAVGEALTALNSGKMIGTVKNDNVTQGKMTMVITYYLAVDDNPIKYIDNIDDGKYYWAPYEKKVVE